jgi:hypothetical protein
MQVFVTDLQAAMIKKIASDPEWKLNGVDGNTFATNVLKSPLDHGVFLGLQLLGLVWNHGDLKNDQYAFIGFTEKGLEILKTL